MYVSEEERGSETVSYFAQSKKTRKQQSQDSNVGLLTLSSVLLPLHNAASQRKYWPELTTLEFFSIEEMSLFRNTPEGMGLISNPLLYGGRRGMRPRGNLTFLHKRQENFELGVAPQKGWLYFARDREASDINMTSEKFPKEGLTEIFLKNKKV